MCVNTHTQQQQRNPKYSYKHTHAHIKFHASQAYYAREHYLRDRLAHYQTHSQHETSIEIYRGFC